MLADAKGAACLMASSLERTNGRAGVHTQRISVPNPQRPETGDLRLLRDIFCPVSRHFFRGRRGTVGATKTRIRNVG